MTSQIIVNYAKACEEAIKLSDSINFNIPRPNYIIFAGVGGSGVAGSLARDVADLDIPVEVVNGYHLPKYVNSDSLVVCISYSGNTEETLSQFTEAIKRKCFVISITSGGKLLEWSKKLNIPAIQIPPGYQPRETIPYLFFGLTACLEKFGMDLSEDKKEFLSMIPQIDFSKIDKIAEEIKDSIPLIYGSSEFSGVLKRIKNELNENSKMVAKFEELPEMNHNEIVGFEIFKHPNLSVVLLRDSDEGDELLKRIEMTIELVKNKVKNYNEIWTYGKSKLSKVMSLVYQGGYLSFKIAELKGVDWKQTKTIDTIKEGLKELGTVQKLESELGFIS